MKKQVALAALAFIGFGAGFLGQNLVSSGSSYCSSIEDEARQQQKFNGSIGCYPPGVLEVNLSEKVNESSRLRCVCRKIDESGSTLYPVTVSDQ
ncbi:MAG: hypothetical protein ABEJ56_03625 [Candidatus Nanohaloarchaea archaeon]